MGSVFDLVLSLRDDRFVELRLLDDHGAQLAFREVDFSKPRYQPLFGLRRYLRTYVEEEQERAEVKKLGVVIAEEVLGAEIFEALWRRSSHRTLRVRLPAAGEEEDPLVARLVRVPWEIARPRVEDATLFERNLVVRLVHEGASPVSAPLVLGPEEPLRMLFVFAEAQGSTPLGARRERRALERLLRERIYPRRRVVADFLVHGVTRNRLEEQLQSVEGYHVIHWSGHGLPNGLELAKPGGGREVISSRALLRLFESAGGFFPRFVFLSACSSGEVSITNWESFAELAQGREPRAPASHRDLEVPSSPGFTGVAHAFLQAGVPAVVAMRDSVRDDYARELALDFYDSVLADEKPKNVATALNLARKKLLHQDGPHFFAADPATPVLFGAEDAGLKLPPGRSPALDGRDRRLHRIAELTLSSHEHFVGRVWELDGLGAEFIGTTKGTEVKPVAVITGLGGMGKTALVAEVLDLWEGRFAWVATYQAKPNALGFDAFLRDLNLKLRGELGIYHQHVQGHPAAAIYRDASEDFTGEARSKRLIQNLLRALRDEPILLVLDNFETNLKPTAEEASVDGEPVWKCQDPAWDELLTELASGLRGSGSRVLVTSRWLPAALAGGMAHRVPLGPLPAGEAQLYLREHPTLWPMLYGTDGEEKQLVHRLLAASRFHPLLMDRLAKLTATPDLRPQLEQVLVSLESRTGFDKLPELFATERGDLDEVAYLQDALVASNDLLIASASPDARRLLWMIAVANEPVALGLLESVWGEGPEIEPLLRHLVGVGLVTQERLWTEDDKPELGCHELVRERSLKWGRENAEELGGKTANAVRLGYEEWLEGEFEALLHKNLTLALEAGRRALVYCVQAEAWERLGRFVSTLVTSSRDSLLLTDLVPLLQTAAESAPEGPLRWRLLSSIGDALMEVAPDASLIWYQLAYADATEEAHKGNFDRTVAVSDLAVIASNWANSLRLCGHLNEARQKQIEAARAHEAAGRPRVFVLGAELEAIRIEILQGNFSSEGRIRDGLSLLRSWWQAHQSGVPPADAPDLEDLTRTLLGALDITREILVAKESWQEALLTVEESIGLKEALRREQVDIADDRLNRAELRRRIGGRGGLNLAKKELEECRVLFENDPRRLATAEICLAGVCSQQGDTRMAVDQARRSLTRRSQLPQIADRASAHNNLANYLNNHHDSLDHREANLHRLAGLCYVTVLGKGVEIRVASQNFRELFRRAHAAGTEPTIPRLSDLLADPAFDSLKTWLESRQVDLDELQAAIDQFLDKARQAALAEP